MTVTFFTEYATPTRPHGDDVEVVYDPVRSRIVEATYVDNAKPVVGKSLRFLTAKLDEAIEMVGGFERFREECMSEKISPTSTIRRRNHRAVNH